MFAASMPSKSVARRLTSTMPDLNEDPLYSTVQGLVMAGNVKVSDGNKAHGLCATKNCTFVVSIFHPGIAKATSALCHFAGSTPHLQYLGNPTDNARSVTLTGESFSTIKLKVL